MVCKKLVNVMSSLFKTEFVKSDQFKFIFLLMLGIMLVFFFLSPNLLWEYKYFFLFSFLIFIYFYYFRHVEREHQLKWLNHDGVLQLH